MFKRITSNRDPEATVWKELRREFGQYFTRLNTTFRNLCAGHPRTIFGLMLTLLLFSAVLSFTAGRRQGKRATAAPAQRSHAASPHPHSPDDGFSRILQTGAALQRTLALKKEVESTLAKGRLSHSDSLLLENALDSLRQLQHQIH